MEILKKTQSLCPTCGKSVPAAYAFGEAGVFFLIECPQHGAFTSPVCQDRSEFLSWIARGSVTVPPRVFITKGAKIGAYCAGNSRHMASADPALQSDAIDLTAPAAHPSSVDRTAPADPSVPTNSSGDEDEDAWPGSSCPLHCGVCENHLMTACCVLLDVTDRCNQQCPFCFARAEKDAGPDLDPPLSTVARWYDRLIDLGEERPFNIQLSGGEPTVRNDLPAIIRMGREKGFEYIQLNTNGRRLAEEAGYAASLKAAGLTTVFLQFDGTEDAIHVALRSEPLRAVKQAAIENCGVAGLPVTLVPTLVNGVNLQNVGAMLEFMLNNLHVVKGIHFQPVSFFGRYPGMKQAAASESAGGDDPECAQPRQKIDVNGSAGDGGDAAPDPFAGRVTMFDLLHEIESQSSGRIRFSDLPPITTGHPLCCFCGSFLKERSGKITSLISEKQREEGLSCCCTPAPDPLEIIRKDRDFVLNKWSVSGVAAENTSDSVASAPCCGVTGAAADCGQDADKWANGTDEGSNNGADNGMDEGADDSLSLDDALLYLRRNMFTVSGMAFMDGSNLDAARLKRCRVQVFTKDERLIPFCAYNSIYRV